MHDPLHNSLGGILSARLIRGYTTFPSWLSWCEAGLIFALYSAVALPIGLTAGMLEWKLSQDSPGQLALVAIVAFFVPSLLEETLYRSLLLPAREEEASWGATIAQTAISITAFVAGHPLVAWLFAPDARKLFYDPTFLVLSALFGVATSVAYLRTGSIWPSVVMHWLLVVAWAWFLGGWIMAFGAK